MPATFDRRDYYNRLHALRTRLDADAAQLRDECSHGAGGEATEGFGTGITDSADLASQQSEVAVSIGLAQHEANLRMEVDAALDRVSAGTFGICEECGAVMGVNRLDAIPYARFCVRCERRIEEETAR